MFELLNAYEPAKNEKNKVLRYFYLKYVRYKLKKSFFIPFRAMIKNSTSDDKLLDNNLLLEFAHFFNCVEQYVSIEDLKSSHINIYFATWSHFRVNYYGYNIEYTDRYPTYNIDVVNIHGKHITLHPEHKIFESSIWASIIIMAIYNYCVTYVYGKDSDLFINNDYYSEVINSMYI
jgi:hypothetical protein